MAHEDAVKTMKVLGHLVERAYQLAWTTEYLTDKGHGLDVVKPLIQELHQELAQGATMVRSIPFLMEMEDR